MKFHKITWLMIGAGVVNIVATLVLAAVDLGNGVLSPFQMAVQLLASIPFFFFAGVLEFLARITNVLESAAARGED